MPEKISSTVERLTVQNQRFLSTTLSADNFTQFAPPHISLKQLAIRHTNIKKIEPRAFSALTKLESLDLSNNDNLIISTDSFNGLKIRILIINNINGLSLKKDVFRGLDVMSLSISNCGITTIDYDTLHPLSKSLLKLFLQKNQIKTLEPKLNLIFKQLDSLDLSENDFHCDCNIKWIAEFYKERLDNKNFNVDKFQTSYRLLPKCASPKHLESRMVTKINNEEIVCESPRIFELNLQLNTLSDAVLICTGQHQSWQAPMQITWYNTSLANEQINSETFVNKSKSIKSVAIRYLKEVGYYKCVINNSFGEASAMVRVNWPNIAKNIAHINDYEDIMREPQTPNIKMRSWRMIFFERRFTLLEIIAAVTGTILFTGLLFILIHRFVMAKCVLVKKKNAEKKSSRQSNLATLSLTTSYEPAVYSNSQTYDLPGVGYAGSNLHLPTAASSTHQFLDFKTHRKIYR